VNQSTRARDLDTSAAAPEADDARHADARELEARSADGRHVDARAAGAGAARAATSASGPTLSAGRPSTALVAATDFDSIAFQGICYDYGRRRVLSRVTLNAAAGTITGILGPNGAGKSTLLSIASTRARPSQGIVRYGALPESTPQTALRARIGWLGHDPGFYPELTARENLTFYARLHGVPAVDTTVAEALAHAGLTDRRDDAVGGFSRGMRQRLGLERVLLHRPRLVLLDEPFTGLDDASARALLQRLTHLRDDGRIVLLSTHDLDFVSDLLDRAAIIRNGRVVDDFDVSSSFGADTLVDRYRRLQQDEPELEGRVPGRVVEARGLIDRRQAAGEGDEEEDRHQHRRQEQGRVVHQLVQQATGDPAGNGEVAPHVLTILSFRDHEAAAIPAAMIAAAQPNPRTSASASQPVIRRLRSPSIM
jgi:heme ABC exporter ATP-binding subunit CcmA